MIVRILILFLVFVSNLSMDFSKKTDGKNWKVLYIGNSLTYTNGLPSIVEEIAKQDGITISSATYLLPDYSLEDHWNGGTVQDEIEKGKYDFVIAQQGPSALPESQVLLLDYAGRFAEICKKENAKFALYMVWPSKARSFDLDNVILSYTKASQKTGSLLCPAGLAWKNAWQTDETMPLYGPDNFHPSVTGSVLAALTIYGSLAGKKDFSFIQYDSCSWKKEMSNERLGVLKKSALKAMSLLVP